MKDQDVEEVAVDCRCLLGEGVTWDAASSTLLWVDVDRHLLHRLDVDGRHSTVQLERRTSAVVPRAGGGLIGVAGIDIVAIDAQGRVESTIASLPPDGDGVANDARCDPLGRLWVGTVDRSGANRAGLFRVDRHGDVVEILTGRALSNGLDWSPDGRRCYFADSLLRRIDELSLDDAGEVRDVREFARFDGMPDGVSVDEEGGVWVAVWDGGCVHRFTADGRLDRTLSVPGGWITNCAFGGVESRTLFITTARTRLYRDAQARYPQAGSLFRITVDVAGRGYTPFG
jgi:sugar lactone lactonase YvrE